MTEGNFKEKRIYVDFSLQQGASCICPSAQAHYLVHVLRLKVGDKILVFNGSDGEWIARLKTLTKRELILGIETQVRSQTEGQDLDYIFAPLKHARLDYMVQKATEMGVRRLCPIFTQHTCVERINLHRMRANIIEAAEQCGLLSLPEIVDPKSLNETLKNWDQSRKLIFCDEGESLSNPLLHLSSLKTKKIAVMIGPEGGFSKEERELIRQQRFTCVISLGPRIMRADTAAIAALSLVNATLGDWS